MSISAHNLDVDMGGKAEKIWEEWHLKLDQKKLKKDCFSDCLFLRRYNSLASVHWGLTLCQHWNESYMHTLT